MNKVEALLILIRGLNLKEFTELKQKILNASDESRSVAENECNGNECVLRPEQRIYENCDYKTCQGCQFYR